MKEYATDFIRNIALVSHGGGGKTILSEAMLFVTNAITRMGKVEEGNTVSDFEDEEIRRQLSLSTGVIPVEFDDHKLNLLDTPGYTDFIGEVISALTVADGALVLVDAVAGVEVGTEIVWDYAVKFGLPRLVLVTKMDRENANFQAILNSVSQLAGEATLIPVQLPWGAAQDLKGVIDLFNMKARPGDGSESEDIPAELADEAEAGRIALVEAAAEGDDVLLEKYLNGDQLTPDEISRGFKKAVWSGRFIPVFVSAAAVPVGIVPLLESLVNLMPSPAEGKPRQAQGAGGVEELVASDSGPLAAYVWKTTADPFVGKLTYLRVFSGTLSSDSPGLEPHQG